MRLTRNAPGPILLSHGSGRPALQCDGRTRARPGGRAGPAHGRPGGRRVGPDPDLRCSPVLSPESWARRRRAGQSAAAESHPFW